MDILDQILGAEMANEYTDGRRITIDFDKLFPGINWMNAAVTAISNGGSYVIPRDNIDALRSINAKSGAAMSVVAALNNSKVTIPVSYLTDNIGVYQIGGSFLNSSDSQIGDTVKSTVISAQFLVNSDYVAFFAQIIANFELKT